MPSTDRFAWRWQALEEAREPRAAVAFGAAARRLHARVAAAEPERQALWTATAAPDLLVVIGDAASLPWADGVGYAAPHPVARSLWLPTNEEIDLPADLAWRALERHHRRAPLLLWPRPDRVVPLDRAQAVDDALLALVAGRWQGGAR